MAYKYKRKGSPFWWIGWYNSETKRPGKPFSTKTANERLADQKVRDFARQLRDRRIEDIYVDSNKKLILSAAFELYKKDRASEGKEYSDLTIENYDRALGKFYTVNKDKDVRDYTKDDYLNFFDSMSDLSQNSKAVYTKCIFALFRWLQLEGKIKKNYMKRVKEEEIEFRIIPKEILCKIVEYADTTKYKYLIRFLILSAFRIHEALQLRPTHIESRIIRVHSKGSKYKHIIITKEMCDFLQEVPLPEDPEALIFPFSKDMAYRFWDRMQKATGISTEWSFHDLRKYCLSEMASSGLPMNFVKDYARHNSINTTIKYYIRADKSRMIEEIDEKVNLLRNNHAFINNNGETSMGMIVITCPVTKKEVPTGIGMTEKGFEKAEISGNSFQCPACGRMHTWDKKDSRLISDVIKNK